jgi:hypothetical protein
VSSNDADQPSLAVALSGIVLDHADASLDSLLSLTSASLDFGDHNAGEFTPLDVKVFDRGWNPLHARLALGAATIAGGAGRFSIVGGFNPVLIADTPAAFSIQFDDNGATVDSTYHATLTFSSADEPLPGAQPQPDLVVTLSAQPASSSTGVPPALPTALRFYPPRPNPTSSAATFAFDLPRAANARLEIFDLAGRRVALLADGERNAGHYELRWDGSDAGGARAQAGLYFVRFATPGLTRVERVARLP